VTVPDDPLFAGTTAPEPDEDRPGPWVEAAFRSPCAHGDMIVPGDTIRCTGEPGEWEHQDCFGDGVMSGDAFEYRGWMERDPF